ncbi:unnamed protein product [Cylicostephanus goldi]|uniref:Uncharacterized protein n=1 Tax=Cylicostephanus goldi TaxID=71465 RepID=A0A3P6QUW9_CYLGO|nr:unnamed protein product [Cylicostephanus goldi]
MLPIINVTLGVRVRCCCRKRRKRPPPKKGVLVKIPTKTVSKEKFAKPKPLSLTSSSTPSIPDLLTTPLAKTQTEEELFTSKDMSFEKIPIPIRMKYDRMRRSKSAERIESRKLLPYPEVKPPTLSEKRRHERELERDKKAKIASGFYQSRSDEDDTLEKVSSLKEEYTERSHKLRRRGTERKEKAERKDEKEAPLENLLLPLPPPLPPPT